MKYFLANNLLLQESSEGVQNKTACEKYSKTIFNYQIVRTFSKELILQNYSLFEDIK